MGRVFANNRTVNDFSAALGAYRSPSQRIFSIRIDQDEKNHRAFERSPLLAQSGYATRSDECPLSILPIMSATSIRRWNSVSRVK